MTLTAPEHDQAAPRQASDPDKRFPVRRVSFEEAIEAMQSPIDTDGDVILSHLIGALSGVFPDGEEMFVESVRHYRDQITDPDLKAQVNAFIGQEVTHGREHRLLNRRLGELGYRSSLVEATMADPFAASRFMKAMAWLFERFGPVKDAVQDADGTTAEPDLDPMFKLALTAALEHFTATLAEALLTEHHLQRRFRDPEIFRMWAWHAIEECEHKSVAFDVYRAVGGSEETRIKAMKTAKTVLIFLAGYHTVVGAITDRSSYPFRIFKNLWELPKNPLLSKKIRSQLNDYYRPDFHPLQHDTTDIESAWRTWLDDDGPRPEVERLAS